MFSFIIDLVLSIVVFFGVYADVQHWYTAFVVAMLFLAVTRLYEKRHSC